MGSSLTHGSCQHDKFIEPAEIERKESVKQTEVARRTFAVMMKIHFLFTLLMGFSILSQIACSSESNNDDHQGRQNLSESKDNVLAYYSAQSAITDAGEFVHLYEDISSEVSQIVKAVQGVIIGSDHAGALGFELPRKRRQHEENLRKVEDMLKCITAMDDRALVELRPPDKRLIGSCRHFAVLTCSLLRHKKIPARARGGFETHHSPVRHHDHWICEYWNPTQRRWVQVDAEMDSDLKQKWHIDFDPLDLPAGTFMTGAEAWQRCRKGELNPKQFGVGGGANEWIGGWNFVLSELLLDLMALNKFELLPWDTNRLSEKEVSQLSESEYALLDSVAQLINEGDNSFPEVRRLYETNSSLRMPWYWRP